MAAPADRRYTKSHEWHKSEGELVTIGITKFAADELTDITFVDLPEVGAKVTAGEAFGEIESVKATSELYSGVTGEVTAVNAALTDNPALVNDDSFEGGWMIKVKMSDPSQLEALLSPEDYNAMIGS
jgi:glycine cleavage system H protein